MEPELAYYEPRYWGLDPLFSSKMKLNVCDVLSLKYYPGFQDIYCILNHAIGQVHIMGDVLSAVKKTRLIQYELDDGTGVINCTQWRKVDDSDQGLCVASQGQLVSVFGKVSEFRNMKQLTVTGICPESDPNVEPLFWLEVIKLRKEVYSKPFHLPPGINTRLTSAALCLQQLVYSELKKWILTEYRSKSFSLGELEANTSFIELCMKSLQDQNRTHSRAEVVTVIKASIIKLRDDGVVVSTGTTGGTKREMMYKIFSAEKDLFPVVLSYLARRQQSSKVLQLGVPEAWIIEAVQQCGSLRLVPRAVVVAAISDMVDKSFIYPQAPKSYKLV